MLCHSGTLSELTFVVGPATVHSTKEVLFPSVEQADQWEEPQEGGLEVVLRGEGEEEAFRGACPLQGGENS